MCQRKSRGVGDPVPVGAQHEMRDTGAAHGPAGTFALARAAAEYRSRTRRLPVLSSRTCPLSGSWMRTVPTFGMSSSRGSMISTASTCCRAVSSRIGCSQAGGWSGSAARRRCRGSRDTIEPHPALPVPAPTAPIACPRSARWPWHRPRGAGSTMTAAVRTAHLRPGPGRPAPNGVSCAARTHRSGRRAETSAARWFRPRNRESRFDKSRGYQSSMDGDRSTSATSPARGRRSRRATRTVVRAVTDQSIRHYVVRHRVRTAGLRRNSAGPGSSQVARRKVPPDVGRSSAPAVAAPPPEPASRPAASSVGRTAHVRSSPDARRCPDRLRRRDRRHDAVDDRSGIGAVGHRVERQNQACAMTSRATPGRRRDGCGRVPAAARPSATTPPSRSVARGLAPISITSLSSEPEPAGDRVASTRCTMYSAIEVVDEARRRHVAAR